MAIYQLGDDAPRIAATASLSKSGRSTLASAPNRWRSAAMYAPDAARPSTTTTTGFLALSRMSAS